MGIFSKRDGLPVRWSAAPSEVFWRSLGPAAVVGGLLGLILASPAASALPGKWEAIVAASAALIVLGSVAGVLAALIAGRIIGSAGWRSYAVIFAMPLIGAAIPWWASPTSIAAAVVALSGGAFIGRYIIHRPNSTQTQPDRPRAVDDPAAPLKELDPDRSIIGLRLEDAMVDADGVVYGTGTLDFAPDDQGRFMASPGSAVSMRLTVDDELIFASCEVERDDVTGYLVGRASGPVLVVPQQASSVIRAVLRHASAAPQSFSVQSGGALVDGELVQGLTDMFGSVQSFGEHDDDGGVVVVQLTASLRAGRKQQEYWPASAVPEKVSLSFTITPMERVVRFGAHSRALPGGRREARQSLPSELETMRLADTLITSVDQSYGRSEDGSLVALHYRYYREPTLTLEFGLPERRERSGLIAMTNGYPRIRFTPVDLDEVAEGIGPDLHFAVELGGGSAESIQYTSNSPEGPGRYGRVSASRLDFEICRAGLVIDWIAYREDDVPMRGRVTVPWEVLVMRFPRFARHRQSLLERRPAS